MRISDWSSDVCSSDLPTERTERYLTGGRGGLVGFELKTGDPDAGARFIDALQMIYHVANIGDTHTLAIHPASSTHQQLSPEDQIATGVTPGYLRLSVGIEHIDDRSAESRVGQGSVSTCRHGGSPEH